MTKMSLAETAVKLGVSIRTLRRRIKEGIITPVLEGGKYYLTASDLDKLSSMARLPGKLQSAGSSGPSRVIVIDKSEYDRLLARLGFLEGQHQLLLQHKPADDALRRELGEAKSRLAGLEEEFTRLKKRLDAIQGLIMKARLK